MQKILLGIEGMSCAACSSAIEHYVGKQKGIESVAVNLVMAYATIVFDETILTKKQIEGFIKQSGYKSTGIYKPEDSKRSLKKSKINLAVFGVIAFLLLYISMGSMIGLPVPYFIKNSKVVLASVTLGLTLPLIFYGADIFFRGIKNFFRLHPNMDSLVTLGVFASFGFSLYSFVMVCLGNAHYVHSLYFESAGIIIYFIKLGKFLEALSKDKTKSAVKGLVEITPKSAVILRDNKEVVVSLDEIKKGDIVVCKAGEKIAVDGEVIFGETHVDESFITGESKPAEKSIGSKVIAGSINFDGYIKYRAENIGRDSTISKIVNMVVEASNTKMKISRIADKASLVFTPVVLSLALITFAVYLIAGYPFADAITTFTTILVVACPCSLGLATPVAIVVSEGALAKNGILVKNSEVLERVNKVDTIVFDKTGTLTTGKLTIKKIVSTCQDEAMDIAVSMEKASNHPIASAFKDFAKENNVEGKKADKVQEIGGMGIVGEVGGDKVFVGNKALMDKFGIEATQNLEEEMTVVYVAKNKSLIATIYLEDALKENAKAMVENFVRSGIDVVMLTGDNEKVAERVAKELGIKKVFASVVPKEKAEIIKRLKGDGHIVAMVGDGINDSPALTLSNVGISVHTGTDIAMNSAGVVLMSDDLSRLGGLFLAGRKTVRNIKQNLFASFFYNALMIPIAMGVFRFAGLTISPMIAALAMTLSSVTVVLNALRLSTMNLGGKYGKSNNKN